MISILIPTYNRPDFLKKAIESCLDVKDYRVEILVGDDSQVSNITIINGINLPSNYTIHYYHHSKALKQNQNVDDLLMKASGNYGLILHDDDYLLGNGLSQLIQIAKAYPTQKLIVFGKQILIDDTGNFLNSNNLNKDYLRIKELEGLQENAVNNVLLQQVPSDSFLFPLEIAKTISYRHYNKVGDACDFDFALRMVLEGECELFFIYENISAYRISQTSVSRGKAYNSIYFKYEILKELDIKTNYPKIYQKILYKDINILCGYYINNKYKKKLRNLYFNSDYPIKKRFTIRGIYHLAMIFIK